MTGHEEVRVERGPRSGVQIAVAVHSTGLGPALGGARLWRYGAPGDAVADALRLSEAMTLKASAAGLDLGGGKSALSAPATLPPAQRRVLMLDLGDLVESLEGRYVVAEDVGTTTDDMTVIAERTSHVVGLPAERGGSGDPSPFTARGVEAAMRAACAHWFDASSLAGIRICVVGLGHVGTSLAERLAAAGAELVLTDLNPGRSELAERLDAEWIEPGEAVAADCDVLAPCALGGTIDESSAARLKCAVVCGSANNTLASEGLAGSLDDRGILYAPDFIANAGGLISVYGELRSLPADRVDGLVDGIETTMAEVLAEAGRREATPLEAAHSLAAARLDRARPEATPARLSA
jgi:leucine dehydrogenase